MIQTKRNFGEFSALVPAFSSTAVRTEALRFYASITRGRAFRTYSAALPRSAVDLFHSQRDIVPERVKVRTTRRVDHYFPVSLATV